MDNVCKMKLTCESLQQVKNVLFVCPRCDLERNVRKVSNITNEVESR